MSSIRLSGTSSGYYDLTVPAVAGTNSIDLSTLAVKDSNGNLDITGNLGVGTTTPLTPVSKFGGSASGLAVKAGQPTVAVEASANTQYVGYLGQAGTNTYLGGVGGGSLIVQTGTSGTSNMLINSGGAVTMPNQPMVETYYTNANQHGAYNAGSSRNMTVFKPGGVRFYTGNNMYDSGTGRYTAQHAGTYYACWGGSQYNSNVTNYFMIQIRKNGSTQKQTYFNKTNLGSWVHLTGSAYFQLAVGDYIDFNSNHDSTGGDKGGFDVQGYTNFTVRMVG